MSKFTVWMSGEDTLYAWNRCPRKFENIEANTFADACIYVWEYYHLGKEGRWLLDTDNETFNLRHTSREWEYGLFQTEEEAELATRVASRNPKPLKLTYLET